MQLRSDSFDDKHPIPAEFAFGKPGAPVALSANRNPHLAWRDAPPGTRSFVITLIDDDAPSRGDDVNQPDREVPPDLPRVEFVHWLLANVPPDCGELAAGSCSDGITARGKTVPFGPPGSVQGQNDYTGWFAGDPDMAGTWLGYDGPCPPWNDSRIHHYHLSVLALDVARLDLASGFTLQELRAAVAGHVLATAVISGTYTLNPRLFE
ncbi:MAG TPA: YbhB/YbcL family Raf kinase inhibitor-like protein [Rhodanobacteraceae bacterium]|nr:YbhB/YbcL family Raf kinase inhibitor-like protein [Rhodanobacteraceae bacterium]